MARSKNYSVKATISAVDQFTRPLKLLQSNIRGVTRSITGAVTGVTGKIMGIGAALGMYAGVSQIKESFGGWLDKAGEIGDMAKQLGMSASALQELQWAAKMSDVDLEAFTQGINVMNRNLGQARLGTGALKTWLDKQPASFRKAVLGAKSTSDAFELVIGAIHAMPSEADKAALATAAFGRGGLTMVRMASEGVPGLRKLRAEMVKLGVITQEQADAADNLQHSQIRLKQAIEGVKNQVYGGLLKVLQPIIDKMTAWVTANQAWIASKLNDAIQGVVDVARDLWRWIDKNKDAIRQFAGTSFEKMKDAVKTIRDHWDGILTAVEVIFGVWLVAKAVGIIGGIANAVGLLAEAWAGMKAVGAVATATAMGTALLTIASTALAIMAVVNAVKELTNAWESWKVVRQSDKDSVDINAQTNAVIDQKNIARRAQGLPEIPHVLAQTRGMSSPTAKTLSAFTASGGFSHVSTPSLFSRREKTDVGGEITVRLVGDTKGARVESIHSWNPIVKLRAQINADTGKRTPGMVTQ